MGSDEVFDRDDWLRQFPGLFERMRSGDLDASPRGTWYMEYAGEPVVIQTSGWASTLDGIELDVVQRYNSCGRSLGVLATELLELCRHAQPPLVARNWIADRGRWQLLSVMRHP